MGGYRLGGLSSSSVGCGAWRAAVRRRQGEMRCGQPPSEGAVQLREVQHAQQQPQQGGKQGRLIDAARRWAAAPPPPPPPPPPPSTNCGHSPVARGLTLGAGASASAGSASAATERTIRERGAAGRAWRGCSAARLLPHCPRAVPRNDMAPRALRYEAQSCSKNWLLAGAWAVLFSVFSTTILATCMAAPAAQSRFPFRRQLSILILASGCPLVARASSVTRTLLSILQHCCPALQAYPRTTALPLAPPGQRQRPSRLQQSSVAAPQPVRGPPPASQAAAAEQQRSSMAAPASLRAFTGFRTQGKSAAADCTAMCRCSPLPAARPGASPPPPLPAHPPCAHSGHCCLCADSMPVRPQTTHSTGFWQASQRAVANARCGGGTWPGRRTQAAAQPEPARGWLAAVVVGNHFRATPARATMPSLNLNACR